MRRTVATMAVAAALIIIAGCSGKAAPTMPDVVGKHLDVAINDVKRAGANDDVEVLGGGTFGILDKSNWTVCSQEPKGGAAITATPRVTVERTCEGAASPKPTAEAARPTPSPTESEVEPVLT